MKQPFNTPEQDTEQPKETIADCGKKTLMDTPTIADHIGSHMNLAFGYAKELVSENTRLRAQLYRLPILEQENAQLKEQQQNTWSEKQTLKNALAKIAELENKLNFANPQLLSLSQANADLQKQVKELTQQVFDLNRVGANFERENKQLVSDLAAANLRIAELLNLIAKPEEAKLVRSESLQRIDSVFKELHKSAAKQINPRKS